MGGTENTNQNGLYKDFFKSLFLKVRAGPCTGNVGCVCVHNIHKCTQTPHCPDKYIGRYIDRQVNDRQMIEDR